MLSSKLSQNMDEPINAGKFRSIEMSEVIDGGSNESPVEAKTPSPRKNRKLNKQLSFQLSFRSSAEMHSAIKLLQIRNQEEELFGAPEIGSPTLKS